MSGGLGTDRRRRRAYPLAPLNRGGAARVAWSAIGLAAICLVAALPAAAQVEPPALELEPNSGPAGATIAATGSGFGGFCGALLYWTVAGEPIEADTPVLETLPLDARGGFEGEILIPTDAEQGDHDVTARALAVDEAGHCTRPTRTLVAEGFVVEPSPPPPTVDLAVSTTSPAPGAAVVAEATGDGAIDHYAFDLNGNGSFETECESGAAAVVNAGGDAFELGVKAVAPGGASSSDTVQVSPSGSAVPPPPGASPLEPGTMAGTCTVPGPDIVAATLKIYTCPEVVQVGVAEAIMPDLPGEPCFERKFAGSVLSQFVATSTQAIVNGLRINTYDDHLVIADKLEVIAVDGSNISDDEAEITVKKAGFHTSILTKKFTLANWDISKPGTVATVPLSSFGGGKWYLGLPYGAKSTPLKLTALGTASFPVHLKLPLPDLLFDNLVTSPPVTVKTTNSGGGDVEVAGGLTLSFPQIPLGVFSLDDLTVSYSRQGPSDVWHGSLKLAFPASSIKAGGEILVRDAQLKGLGVQVGFGRPGVGPIGCCVYLVGAGLEVNYVSIGGSATFAAGPTIVGNLRAAEATANVSMGYDPWYLLINADGIKIVTIDVDAEAGVLANTSSFVAYFLWSDDFGPFSATAGVSGLISGGGWYMIGTGEVCIDWFKLGCVGGGLAAGSKGVSACAKINIKYAPDLAGGALVRWNGVPTPYWGCSWGGLKAKVGASAAAARAAADVAATSLRVRVPKGRRAVLFEIAGRGGAPEVLVKPPRGKAIVGPADGEPSVTGNSHFAAAVSEVDRTYVIATGRAPGKNVRPGRWRIIERPGSAAVTGVRLADPLPRRLVTGRVAGRGAKRTLRYRVRKAPGTRITFIERTRDGGAGDPPSLTRQVGRARAGRGRIRFAPGEASPRGRVIEAVVRTRGVVTETERVATYRAPKLKRLPGPRVRVDRGKRTTVRWSRVPGAGGYRLIFDPSDRQTVARIVGAGRRGAKVGPIGPLTEGRVEVRALSRGGYLGRPGRARLRPRAPLAISRRQSIGAVLRRGALVARCTAAGNGTCEANVRRSGKQLAAGATEVAAGRSRRLRVGLTKAGRKLLRKGRRFGAKLSANVPARPPLSIKLRFR